MTKAKQIDQKTYLASKVYKKPAQKNPRTYKELRLQEDLWNRLKKLKNNN